MKCCDICSKELIEGEGETLETPNFKWDLCLDCAVNIETDIEDNINRMRRRKK